VISVLFYSKRICLIKSRRYFRGPVKPEERHRLNEKVKASQVRLIDENGKLIGLMSSYEALETARARDLDLFEIHNQSDPPVCKIMNYGKWKFETKKKEKQYKKNQSKVLLKEIQIRTRTDEGDIKIKLQKAREFLLQGHKVKINLRFFGREMAHKELGLKILKEVGERLSDIADLEKEPKMERRTLFSILAPATAKSTKKNKAPKAEDTPPSSEPLAKTEGTSPASSESSAKTEGTPPPSSELSSAKTEGTPPPSSELSSAKTEGTSPASSELSSAKTEGTSPASSEPSAKTEEDKPHYN